MHRRSFARWIALGLALAGLGAAGAHASATGEVVVRMRGFRSDRGRAYVALWRKPEGFPGHPPPEAPSRVVPIGKSTAEARFEALAPGSFAVTVFHDENDDSELEENFLGIPREGVGFSRNVKPRFRAPRYREAELQLLPGERELVEIEMLYL